ncbi:MAG: GGDEF domain-containing protein [Rubrivivax sp.]|nr:GGDEF domain-containing protein [Rubrivivax sp.]
MAAQPLSVLLIDARKGDDLALAESGWTLTSAPQASAARRHDAVVWFAADRVALADLCQRVELPQVAFDSALVVAAGEADDEAEAELLRLGVQAVVVGGEAPALQRAVRHAVLRKQVERSTRAAYATDLATGLPHEAQLLEHMTQLLALREREPAPMALIVLRVEGYAAAAARLGSEAANVLRRKVAVRLRGGLRASDVVAAIGPHAFAVLLGHLEAQGDGERVAAKLVRALQQPLVVAGQPCTVAAAVGLAVYPEHGKDALALLQRASAQAGSLATSGGGSAGRTERGPGAAANDDQH